MTAAKKFLFDTAFDNASTFEEEERQKEPEVEVTTFSQADVDAAREQGVTAGKEEGIREAANTTEHRIMESLTALVGRLSDLFRSQEEVNTNTARNAITVAAAIARKVLPDLNRRNALGEVERLVEMAMEKMLEDSRVVVRVNPELRDPLAERIDGQTAGTAAEGRVTVSGDADLAVGDCRIEWSDGGAERNTAAMWKDIDAIIERNLGSGAETADQGGSADHAGTAAADAPEALGEPAQEPPGQPPQEAAAGGREDIGDLSEPGAESAPETRQPTGPEAVAGDAGERGADGPDEGPDAGADGGGDPPADEPPAGGAEGNAGGGRDDTGDEGVQETRTDTRDADAQETTTATAGD